MARATFRGVCELKTPGLGRISFNVTDRMSLR
jgi:hypothetical protein